MTVGPWKPIHLHAYTSRLSDIRISAPVDEDFSAKISVAVSATPGAAKATVVIDGPDGATVESSDIALNKEGSGSVNFTPDKSKVQLWYPVGYGKQPLYTAKVQLLDAVSGSTIAEKFLVDIGPQRAVPSSIQRQTDLVCAVCVLLRTRLLTRTAAPSCLRSTASESLQEVCRPCLDGDAPTDSACS